MIEVEIPKYSAIEAFKATSGAFGVAEMIALYNIVLTAPQGIFLELGSHKGKSSQVIIMGMSEGSQLVLVEPEFKDMEWMDQAMRRMVEVVPHFIKTTLLADYSLNVIPKYNDLAFVFIDSGIHDDMVMDEVKTLEDRVKPEGIIAFHDYGNQFTAVARAYDYLVSTGKYETVSINWNIIFDYVRSHNLEDGNVSWHERGSEEFPKFVGAIKRKI